MKRFFASLAIARMRAPIAAVAVLLAGCAQTSLVPAPQAERLPGRELAAVTQTADVRMVVEAGAWNAYPTNLSQELTPLKVTLENRSDQPLRVRYEDFALQSRSGVRYTPLPPLRIEGSVTQYADRPLTPPMAILHPGFSHTGFYIAPWYAPYYTALRPWPRPWAFSPYYYDTYYPKWRVDLPTRDMIERAIPEGVLEAGGRLSGFLYFPELADDPGRVTFTADLLQGEDGQRISRLQVPFEVR